MLVYPGQRPGFVLSGPVALKGQKLSINRQYTKLLPLQGVLLNASILLSIRPERAEAPSPGQRPGFVWSRPVALKGQKLSITRQYTKLLPLQGVLLNASIPRAAPWVCMVQACRPERAKAFN